MWEAIRANTRRSRMLIGVMGAMLVTLGALIGFAWSGAPEGGAAGAVAALLLWLVMLLVALTGGERLVMRTARARKIAKEDSPRLWNVVEEMTIASGLGTPPDVYIVDDDLPNAFAAGRKPENACVAVTSGLLRRLNRDELQGVIAHEIAHIRNLDVRFMTIATVMVGSIVILADIFLRSMWFGGGRRRGSGKGEGNAQLVMVAVTILAAILAPLAANLLYLACSRKREYLADASAARFTRYPMGLASALEKIHSGLTTAGKKTVGKRFPRALAPMYIVNPLQAGSASSGWFSTHPPAQKRIAILRAMGGGAGWVDYERAYQQVMGGGDCLDARTLGSEQSVAARAATPEPDPKREAIERGREVVDLLDRMAEFLLIACPCGVRIKVPPQLKQPTVRCTRCGREHPKPHAEPTVAPGPGARADATSPLHYRRQGEGWESFQCACGKTVQISPALGSASITCGGCSRSIRIESPIAPLR